MGWLARLLPIKIIVAAAALAGARAAGFGGHYLFKLLKMAAHGHDIRTPKVETKTKTGKTTTGGGVSAEKVFDWAKSETVDGLKAIFGDEATAREAARLGGMADGWQRFAGGLVTTSKLNGPSCVCSSVQMVWLMSSLIMF